MAFFNFIETFFFISLGITFVLILMLIYHFKQRITTLEQKNSKMFEIVNNIVKEMNVSTSRASAPTFACPMDYANRFVSVNTMNRMEIQEENKENEENDDSDNEEDEENDDSENDDSENEDSEEEDSDDEDEDSDENDEAKLSKLSKEDTIIVDHLEYIKTDDDIQANFYSIVSEIGEPEIIETKTITIDSHSDENLGELSTIEKKETAETAESENSLEIQNIKFFNSDKSKHVYNKMQLQQLKALVITKGLCSDPSKIKKHDLVTMLEQYHE